MFPDVSASGAGLAIYSAIFFINTFQWGLYQSAQAENQMTSVERVIEYSQLKTEADLESNQGMRKQRLQVAIYRNFIIFFYRK